MTLLLIFQALHNQTIQLEDLIPVSAHAASMGGSQVYLEEGETQTVETLIKCIVVASANDACVAMAEQLAGSEEAFVQQMNETAASLGMLHTHFANCCGLDTEGHYSTAYDIALMSRELTVNYPEIFDYTSIWMEDITHHTARGDTSFTLNNIKSSDQTIPLCNRSENRFYLDSRFLPVRHRQQRRDGFHRSRSERPRQQRTDG